MDRTKFPVVLIAAMLLQVSSAMATVTITANVDSGYIDRDGVMHKAVTIGYISDVNVRAFALDINVDSGMTIGDTPLSYFLRGESIAPPNGDKGYGIFPGRFRDFINPSEPDWDDPNYSPLTPWNSPGAENTGLGWPKIVVELGTLYNGDANRPDLSGTLFTFEVNSENGPMSDDCNLTIAADVLRGGIVGEDGNEITATNLPLVIRPCFSLCCDCIVPDCVGLTREQCIALIPPGLVIGVECNVPGTGQPLRQIVAQNPLPGTMVPPGTAIDINVVSYPIKYMTAAGSLYVNWQNRNRPACWAYPRQCRGSADGKKAASVYWVGYANLNILKSAFNKTEATFNGGAASGGVSLICSCAGHKKGASVYWVGYNDLAILKAYFNKTEASVPICGSIPAGVRPSPDPNYHYWCVPVGVTCPPGQYCAPPGICPNTP